MKEWMLDVGGNMPGNVFLFQGKKNFIFDADMAYCGERLADNIENALQGGKLDGIFLTHSHYDHISGVPMLRKRWPSLTVYAAPYAAGVLKRESALNMIRQMNKAAASDQMNPEPGCLEYKDEDLQVDKPLEDGETVDMGDYQVTAYATPGHTKDCMSYLIEKNEEKLLLCSETTGTRLADTFIPVTLVGFQSALDAIDKLENLHPDGLLFSHFGYEKADASLWEEMRNAHLRAKDLFIEELKSGKPLEEMVGDLEKYYWTDVVRKYQPHKAFEENTKYMLKVIEREFCQEVGGK